MVRYLDSLSTGPEFESHPPHCWLRSWASHSVTKQYGLVVWLFGYDSSLLRTGMVTTLWVNCPMCVSQISQLSIFSSGIRKWVVIHVLLHEYYMRHELRGWRSLKGTPWLRISVWLQAKVCGLGLWPRWYALSCHAQCCCICSMRLVVLYKWCAFSFSIICWEVKRHARQWDTGSVFMVLQLQLVSGRKELGKGLKICLECLLWQCDNYSRK